VAQLVVVVPCYNEEDRLPSRAFLEYALPGHELLFCLVNDGSRDGTLNVLRKMERDRPDVVSVVDLRQNQGKAEAVRQGFLAALARRPHYVGFWDADLATPLDEIPDFLRLLEEEPRRQMVFGTRVKLMGRTIDRLPLRHYLGRVFATAVSLCLGLEIYDTQCGAKLFRVSPDLERVFAERFRSRWIFDVEIIARFMRLWREGTSGSADESIYELPLRQWRDVAGTKLKATDFLKSARDLWMIRRKYLGRGRTSGADEPAAG
jgi:dolichyl-phosphate beta-glucosyltransferase